MTHSSSRSGAPATASAPDSFAHARLRLSVLYTIGFGLLILSLSGILYHLFASDIHEDMSSVFPEKSEQTRIINQHKGKLLSDMILINGGILIFIACMSYYIAGKTLKPIRENYEAQKNFITDASHSLRTPIAVLSADLEVSLLDRTMKSGLKKKFRSYLEEVRHMKLIVEELLLLFRLDSNQIHIANTAVSLKKLIHMSTDSLRTFAKARHITITEDIRADCRICADSHLLGQALGNIVKNAIEYSDAGGRVRISLGKHTDMAVITVRNYGISIPRSDLARVFRRGYRSRLALERRPEGTGLGLAITKEIIEKHGGSISVTSSENDGTYVILYIPIRG